MHDEASALDVAKEANAEAGAEMRALDKTGQICDYESAAEFGAVPASAAIRIDHTKVRFQRREGIICDFWASRGNNGNQSGLARVRETDQANIGEKLEFEAQVALFAGESIFVLARGLMPGFGKILIATSAASTLRDEHALARDGKIGDGLAGLCIVGQSANGNLEDHVFAGMAGAVGAFAVAAAIGLEFAIVAVA